MTPMVVAPVCGSWVMLSMFFTTAVGGGGLAVRVVDCAGQSWLVLPVMGHCPSSVIRDAETRLDEAEAQSVGTWPLSLARRPQTAVDHADARGEFRRLDSIPVVNVHWFEPVFHVPLVQAVVVELELGSLMTSVAVGALIFFRFTSQVGTGVHRCPAPGSARPAGPRWAASSSDQDLVDGPCWRWTR